MKYSEAKKAIEALSSKYSVDDFYGCFNVNYKDIEIAFVRSKRYSFEFWPEKYFSKLPFSNKLYMILSELAMTPRDERVEEKKYYVKIYDSKLGYLNINKFTDKMVVNNVFGGKKYKTKFTDKEIEQLKQREDIALDWNKVILEEVD